MLYLDNSATTPLHPNVKNAMLPYFMEQFGNPSSKYYELAVNAQKAVEHARKSVADLIECHAKEILFTSGSTESNNLIIKGIVDQRKKQGSHIITSAIEHPSVLEVCHYLTDIGYDLTVLPVDANGRVSILDLEAAIQQDTILVSIQWGNNELGTIQPIEAIASLCLEHGIFFHTDATQVIGKVDVDLSKYHGISALSLSAHKFHGPKGVGALFLRRDTYDMFPPVTPLLHGGGQEYGLRSGTLAVPQIVGMGVACDIAKQNLNKHIKYLEILENHLKEILQEKFGDYIRFNNDSHPKIFGILSVQFVGINNEILVKKLAPIMAISTGSACSSSKPSHVLAAIGCTLDEIRSTVRISISPYTTKEELDIFKEL